MNRLLRGMLAIAVLGALVVTPGSAFANHLCNGTITVAGSYVLPHNLNCPAGTAVTIDADFVNLDLAGFTISGLGTGAIGIDVVAGSDDVLIFNGVVRGFDTGIRAGDCTVQIPPIPDTNNFAIDNLSVRNSGTTGIELCGAEGDMQVRFSSVTGAPTGIDTAGGIAGSEGIVIVHQSVVNNATNGIQLSPINFGESYVQGSFVRAAPGSGTGVNINLGGAGTAYAEVSDSTIRGCDGCLRGIRVSGPGSVLIARNTVRDWDDVGISVNDVPSATIEDSTVRDIGGGLNMFGAIVLQGQDGNSGALISAVSVRDVTGGPGIHLVCSQGVAVEDSVLRDIDDDGILIDDVPPPGIQCAPGVVSQADVLRDNRLLGMGGNGVAITTGTGYTLTDNAALFSALDGFFIGSGVTGCCGTAGAILTGNLGRGSGDDGFQLDTARLELTTNTARNNTGWGFETNFAGPVDVDNGQTTTNNTAGNCSDPSDLPSSAC